MSRTVVALNRQEFGLKIRYHVPAVHAMPGDKVVYIEPGEEALYPSAAQHVVAERRDDDLRYGRVDRMQAELGGVVTRPGMPEARFVPEPFVRQGFSGDIVICPRQRRYGSTKNWKHWQGLANGWRGGVVAAGAPDSSYEVDCPRAWDYERFLDASIEAVTGARVVVATDAGLAHLAVLCGAPLVLISHRGRVAPGPVLDENGRVIQANYWPIRLEEYYHRANWKDSPILVVDGWEYPGRVAQAAEALCR